MSTVADLIAAAAAAVTALASLITACRPRRTPSSEAEPRPPAEL